MTVEFRILALLAFAAGSLLLAQTGAENLTLTVGKSIVIDYPADVSRISTSNPEVVDYVAVTPREILLQTKAQGYSTLIVWSKSGQRTFYSITVEPNLDPLRKLFKETYPTDDIQVQAGRDSISLNGRVSSPAIAERAAVLASSFAKTVVNNLQVPAPPVDRQILLRVKFAELDRNQSNALGVNLNSLGAGNTVARTTTGQFAAPSNTQIGGDQNSVPLSDALNIFAFRPDLNIAAVIRALQARGVLQILAEPNLVTTDNREASFLVGGEFPVPVLQGGANSGAVTVQFREFGIRLTFKPTVTDNKTIKLYVKPEVSSIDLANGVNVSGFNIPALSTRRIESNVELSEGQSFVIAGLVDDRVTENMSKIPGLANIPVLGNLFKSRQENKSRSELVILVTPELATAANSGPKLPGYPHEFLAPSTPAFPAPPSPSTSVKSAPVTAAHAKTKRK